MKRAFDPGIGLSFDGLPEGGRERGRSAVGWGQGKEGWLVTSGLPKLSPLYEICQEQGPLRKELSLAFGSKGFHGDALDNKANVMKTIDTTAHWNGPSCWAIRPMPILCWKNGWPKHPKKYGISLNNSVEKKGQTRQRDKREFKVLETFAIESGCHRRLTKMGQQLLFRKTETGSFLIWTMVNN